MKRRGFIGLLAAVVVAPLEPFFSDGPKKYKEFVNASLAFSRRWMERQDNIDRIFLLPPENTPRAVFLKDKFPGLYGPNERIWGYKTAMTENLSLTTQPDKPISTGHEAMLR